jgi:HK97 family phage major capsid protein
VFPLLKRTTTPQTIYKKQKLDRDDLIDITDFDVVSWLRSEMRIMLDEEIARAILIGDGRSSVEEDHISIDHIRPIWTDDSLYTINKNVALDESATYGEKVDALVDGVIEAQESYEGSGNQVMFCDKWFLTRALLRRNSIGERLWKNKAELASELGVDDIIPTPVFANQKRTVNGVESNLVGIVVDLRDYNVGADKGGEINMFDDFDIDYNQEKYLIETRCSGALIRPYSAIALEMSFASESE